MSELLSKYRKQLMGLSAIFILLYHTYAKFLMGIWFIGTAEGFISRILFYGVDMFFLLSGLGIAHSLSTNSILRFYVNRIKRIFLPIILACLVMMLVDKWPLPIFVNRVTGLFILDNMYSFLWFYPAIVIFYLISPLLYKLIMLIKHKICFSIVFLFVYIAIANVIDYMYGESFESWFGILNRIPIFVFGIVLGCLKVSDDEYWQNSIFLKSFNFTFKKILLLACILAAGGIMAQYTTVKGNWLLVPVSNCFMPNICLAIGTSLLVIALFEYLNSTNKHTKLMNNITVVLNFFGMISFELYIVQEWICKKLLNHLSIIGRHNAVIFDAVCFTIVILSALLLYYVSSGIFKGIDYLFNAKNNK